MVRYLFPGDLIVSNNAGDAFIAANQAFTVWTDRVSGTEVSSQMRAPDGVSVVALVADSNGLRPPLAGPDGVKGPLWCDTGATQRFPMVAMDALKAVLDGGGGGGVSAHSALSGLSSDDHTQYHTDARGDVRYYTKAVVDGLVNAAATAQSSNDRNRQNHTGTQAISTVELLQAALDSRVRFVTVSTGSESRGGSGGLVIWVCPTGVTPANALSGDLIVSTTSGTAPSDTTAPSAPSNVAVSGINSAGFTVSWSAATDNVGVTAYRVLLNGTARPLVTSTSQTFTDLAAGTTYTVQVQARDAAGNWGPLAPTTALSATTSASGGTVERNVFGATAHPGPPAKNVETPITVATAFYTFGSQANGWRSVGGRLYVPAGITVPSSCQLSLWQGGSTPDLASTPVRTAAMTGITAGQWNEARWSSPLTLTPGEAFWIGYKFSDGTYLAVASQSEDAIKSNNTDFLYEAARTEFGLRGRYRYDSGASGGSGGHWGIDAIVDQGAV